jgi:hypothetical protein
MAPTILMLGALSGLSTEMEAQDNENTGFENRRASPRVRTLKKGSIVLQHGSSVYDCIVRNLSETGAMLQVGGFNIPSHFELRVDKIPHHECTVRWRAQNSIGVSFDDVKLAA